MAFVWSRVERRGHHVLLIGTGVLGTPLIEAEVSPGEVAAAAEERLADLGARRDRGEVVTAVARGATVHVRRLFECLPMLNRTSARQISKSGEITHRRGFPSAPDRLQNGSSEPLGGSPSGPSCPEPC